MVELYPRTSHYPLYIFLSHSWRHGHHRSGLHDLLAPEWIEGIDYYDLSVSEEHPLDTFGSNRLLVQHLAKLVRVADVVLMMAGMYANNSDWMRAEATLAAEHDKPVIPVAPYAQERLSSTASLFATQPAVRWQSASVRSSILSALPALVRDNFLAAKELRRKEAVAAAARSRLVEAFAPPLRMPAARYYSYESPPRMDQFGALEDLSPWWTK